MLEIIKSDVYKTLSVLIYTHTAKAEIDHISFPRCPDSYPSYWGFNEDGSLRSPWQVAMDRLLGQRDFLCGEMPSQANLRRSDVLNDLWCWMRRNRDEETENWDVHFVYVPERRFLESITYQLSMGFITSIEVIRK